MPIIRFRSGRARILTHWALAILSVPAVLWAISYFGDCVASSSESYCRNIPDFFASLLFAFYIFQVFGGIVLSAMLFIAAIVMLVLAVFKEAAARRPGKR